MAPMLRHLPNLITVLRMLLVVPLCWLIDDGRYDGALVVAAIAGFSDALDGFLAKRLRLAEWLGGMLDPIADKLLLMAAFLSLAFAASAGLARGARDRARSRRSSRGAVAYHNLIGRFDAQPSPLSKLTTLRADRVRARRAVAACRIGSRCRTALRHACDRHRARCTLASGLHYVVRVERRARRAVAARGGKSGERARRQRYRPR